MTNATLLAPIAQRELAKAYSRQPPAWRPLTRRTDPTHFGRKRRARRARGRRIEARRWIRGRGHWVRFEIDLSRPSLLELARRIHVPVFDEIDRFPVMTDEQAQAYLDSHREQRRMITLNWRLGQPCGPSEDLSQRLIRSHCADAARFLPPLFHSTPEGSGSLTVEQWAAARRTISRQQESPTNHHQPPIAKAPGLTTGGLSCGCNRECRFGVRGGV